MTLSPVSCVGYCGSIEYYYDPFSPCITRMRPVSLCLHSQQKVKGTLSGHWAMPDLCFVTSSDRDFHGQNF